MEHPYDKFHYALQLASKYPSIDFDDDGSPLWSPHFSYTQLRAFYNKEIEEMGISEDDFYQQDSIMPVIEAYGLNKEQFWYAVVYVNKLTRAWIHLKGVEPLPTPVEQLTKMREEISGQNEFKIVIDNARESHSFIMAGKLLIRFLGGALDSLIDQLKESDWVKDREVPAWRMENYKTSEATWYAANLFKQLFESLKLPLKRSRNKNGISYDKNQLIAELISYLKLTDNPNLDGNSIRGILGEEREFKFGIL